MPGRADRVELIGLRSPHAKWFRLPDGARQVELSLKWPVHYLDASGAWQDCDSTLRSDSSVSGYGLSSKGGWSSATRLGKRAGSPVRLERGGCRLSLKPQNVADVAGVVKDNRITFADAWPDTDFSLFVVPEGVRDLFLLKTPLAPSSFSFLVKSDRLELLPNQDGSLYAWSGPFPAFEVLRPWVHDANGIPGPVMATLRTDAGKTYLDLAIDPAWLADPARVFPVTCDPTVIQPDAAAGKDTWAYEQNPTLNYATSTTLYAGADATPKKERGFIEFALATWAGHTCTAAPLELYFQGELDATDRTIGAHKVTAAWDEATLTWNLQPAYDAVATATDIADTLATWLSWDILALVNPWLAGTLSNYGVALVNASEGTASSGKSFCSSDWATAAERPKLTLTFVPPTATGTSPAGTVGSPGTVNDDVSPTLAWTYGGDTAQTKLQARIYTADGSSLVYDSGEVASAAASHTATANALDYGVAYKWQVKVYDGLSWSAYSDWQFFSCVLTAPAGLTATPHAADAHIDLAWTAHAGEDLFGYKVYRKLHAADDSTYVQINYGGLTTNAYVDDTAQTATAYAYAVTAIANDLYESAKCAHVDGTVTYTEAWMGASVVKVRLTPRWVHPRLGSVRTAIDGSSVVQDFGPGPRQLRLGFLYETIGERDTLLALFPAGSPQSYRDGKGYVCRGIMATDADEELLAIPGTAAAGWIEFTISEVTV